MASLNFEQNWTTPYRPPFESNRIYTDEDTLRLQKAGTKVNLRPELMLQRPEFFQKIDSNSKLNVVIIAGAHSLNQTPLFSLKHHELAIKRLIQGLSERKSQVNLFIRPKGHWETLSWFQRFATDTLVAVDKPPNELDLPNMIFVCISQSSSALLEGVARGVPGLTVKEINTADYVKLDQNYFPSTDVNSALSLIDSFANLNNLENLWHSQRIWFSKNIYTQNT